MPPQQMPTKAAPYLWSNYTKHVFVFTPNSHFAERPAFIWGKAGSRPHRSAQSTQRGGTWLTDI